MQQLLMSTGPPVRAAIWMVRLEPSGKVRKPSRSSLVRDPRRRAGGRPVPVRRGARLRFSMASLSRRRHDGLERPGAAAHVAERGAA